MRAILMLLALGVLWCGFTACASCDPDENVWAEVVANDDLNTYSEGGALGAHSLDLYVFKVDEPASFLANDPAKLRVTDQAVRGGQSLGRWSLGPGEKTRIAFGKMENDRWENIGIFAAFGDPSDGPDAQKRVVAIPSGCGFKLVLGARSILNFQAD